ncbi:hypothetical protein ACFVZD_42685 [Streptomyces sp. NPDC058287]
MTILILALFCAAVAGIAVTVRPSLVVSTGVAATVFTSAALALKL